MLHDAPRFFLIVCLVTWGCYLLASVHSFRGHMLGVSVLPEEGVTSLHVSENASGVVEPAMRSCRCNEAQDRPKEDQDHYEAHCYYSCYGELGLKSPSTGALYELAGEQLAQGKYKRVFVGTMVSKPTSLDSPVSARVPAAKGTSVAVAISQNKAGAQDQVASEYRTIMENPSVRELLDCPHVMDIYDGWLDEINDHFVMITEFISGQSVNSFLERREILSLREWVVFARQMLETWSCLFSAGFQQHDAGEMNMMVKPGVGYALIDLDFKALRPGDLGFRAARVFQIALKMAGVKKACIGFPHGPNFICSSDCGGVFQYLTAEQQSMIDKVCSMMEESREEPDKINTVLDSFFRRDPAEFDETSVRVHNNFVYDA